jgi:hypothetical protein
MITVANMKYIFVGISPTAGFLTVNAVPTLAVFLALDGVSIVLLPLVM